MRMACLNLYDVQVSTKEKEAELRAMQEKYGVDGANHIQNLHACACTSLPMCASGKETKPSCCYPLLMNPRWSRKIVAYVDVDFGSFQFFYHAIILVCSLCRRSTSSIEIFWAN